ncbi:MAG: zinc-binding dehydrogenase [Candidatus Dormibacteria bacterium]
MLTPAAIEATACVAVEAGAEPRLEIIEVDPPGPGEVRVRVGAAGVCHTDLHVVRGHFGSSFPYLLGHEAAGHIEAVGAGVDSARIGERVVLNWRAPCGGCEFCLSARAERCLRPQVAGPRLRRQNGDALAGVLGVGAFSSHTVVAEGQAVRLPEEIGLAAGSLVGCGVATGYGAAVNTGAVFPGASVAVTGCGAVGLAAVAGARLAGAAQVIAIDLAPRKLEWAREMGATDTVAGTEAAAAVRELSDGRGVDVAIDAVGTPATFEAALRMTRLGGRTVLVGVPAPGASLPVDLARLFWSRADIRASWYGDCVPARDFLVLFEHHRAGRLNLDLMVTRTLPLNQLMEAFRAMEAGESIRTVLIID